MVAIELQKRIYYDLSVFEPQVSVSMKVLLTLGAVRYSLAGQPLHKREEGSGVMPIYTQVVPAAARSETNLAIGSDWSWAWLHVCVQANNLNL